MKNRFELKTWLLGSIAIMICMLAMPVVTFAQDDPSPAPPTEPNPDHTLSVPFDDNMNMVFIAVAIIFAVIVIKKMQKKIAAL